MSWAHYLSPYHHWGKIPPWVQIRMKIFDISAEISDIDDNRSKIGYENSFERKIAEKSEISPIY